MMARNKNIKIMVGYVSAAFILERRSWLLRRFSERCHSDSESFPIVSPDSIIAISPAVKTWGIFFIERLSESPLQTNIASSAILFLKNSFFNFSCTELRASEIVTHPSSITERYS